MNDYLDLAKSVVETLVSLPSIIVFALACLVMEWVIRRTEWISNKIIPFFLIVVMAVVVPFLVPPRVDPLLSYPALADWIRRISVGAISGLLTWAVSGLVFRFMAKFLPALEDKKAGYTENIDLTKQ